MTCLVPVSYEGGLARLRNVRFPSNSDPSHPRNQSVSLICTSLNALTWRQWTGNRFSTGLSPPGPRNAGSLKAVQAAAWGRQPKDHKCSNFNGLREEPPIPILAVFGVACVISYAYTSKTKRFRLTMTGIRPKSTPEPRHILTISLPHPHRCSFATPILAK